MLLLLSPFVASTKSNRTEHLYKIQEEHQQPETSLVFINASLIYLSSLIMFTFTPLPLFSELGVLRTVTIIRDLNIII